MASIADSFFHQGQLQQFGWLRRCTWMPSRHHVQHMRPAHPLKRQPLNGAGAHRKNTMHIISGEHKKIRFLRSVFHSRGLYTCFPLNNLRSQFFRDKSRKEVSEQDVSSLFVFLPSSSSPVAPYWLIKRFRLYGTCENCSFLRI